MQFISTVSRFLHIMIRYNVDFCKNASRFMPLIILHLNCILLLMMKMNKKQFLFHSWKIRAEGRSPLNTRGTCVVFWSHVGLVTGLTPMVNERWPRLQVSCSDCPADVNHIGHTSMRTDRASAGDWLMSKQTSVDNRTISSSRTRPPMLLIPADPR